MEIKLDKKLLERMQKLIDKQKYKDVDEFINRAAETLLIAEDKVEFFNIERN